MKTTMNHKTFAAPWGKTLRWISALSVALLVVVAISSLLVKQPGWARPLVLLLPAILLGSALFVIRNYTVEPRELLIRRLLWTTRVPLSGLRSAAFQPEAMHGSLRLWGNGGLFSITGWYRNPTLGIYRAFVTELKNTVVLQFEKRVVVISPETPELFVAAIAKSTT
jgi:hypothetical protein